MPIELTLNQINALLICVRLRAAGLSVRSESGSGGPKFGTLQMLPNRFTQGLALMRPAGTHPTRDTAIRR